MATQSSKKCATAYRFQRYHIKLQEGHVLTVKQNRREAQPAHTLQGDTQQCCGLLCICMVLAIFDFAKPSALAQLTRRRYGTVARLWAVMKPYYFTGIAAPELKDGIDSLNLTLRLTLRHIDERKSKDSINASDVSEFAIKNLNKGVLTMLAYRSLKNGHAHWQLGIGVAGMTIGKTRKIDTLLTLDPAETTPYWSSSNARLRMPDSKAEQNLGHWILEGSGCYTQESVQLISAIAFEMM